jgi:hypothetical protein
MEIAVGVVSGNRLVCASRAMVMRVLATGKPLKGPRARAAEAPACMEAEQKLEKVVKQRRSELSSAWLSTKC